MYFFDDLKILNSSLITFSLVILKSRKCNVTFSFLVFLIKRVVLIISHYLQILNLSLNLKYLSVIGSIVDTWKWYSS